MNNSEPAKKASDKPRSKGDQKGDELKEKARQGNQAFLLIYQ